MRQPKMAIRDIVIYPNEPLRSKAERVEEVTDEIRELVNDMAETMYAEPGIGLAANQIGVKKRVAVIDVEHPDGTPDLKVLINPEIVEREGQIEWEEGCLSFPGIHVMVNRSQRVKVRATNLEGEAFEIEGEDLLAVAIQHELDHLDGVTLADKVSFLKKKMMMRELKKHAAG